MTFNKKKLAIIGASYLQLPLVKKAKSLGVEIHCFAWLDGAVCKDEVDFFYPISISDKEEIFKICEKIKIDGILSIATDLAVPTINYIAHKLNLIANSIYSGLISTNKYEMRMCLEKNNCSIPKFEKLTLASNIKSSFTFPIIVKPTDRSGSRGVTKVETLDQLNIAVEHAFKESFNKSILIEEFISGNEVSVETISFNGLHYILAITDKVTTNEPHFVELAHHQPSNLNEEIQNIIKNETIKALEALEIKFGASHSEFKITPTGEVYIIEVGSRMGGDFIGSHLVELSTGFDYLRGVIQIALNNFETPIIQKNRFSGVYFLCKETEKLISFFKKNNEFDFEKDLQNENLIEVTNSNDRSGYLIYQADHRINLL